MKKIFIAMSVAIFIALCSAPSLIKAAVVGTGIFELNGITFQGDLLCDSENFVYPTFTYVNGDYWINSNDQYVCGFYDTDNHYQIATVKKCRYLYIPTLTSSTSYSWQEYTTYFYNNEDDYNDNIPPEFRPEEPSLLEDIWDDFYELYYNVFGIYPQPGSLYDLLRRLALGDEGEDTKILYPTMLPSPTPTPTPTPIPVQTIFVPDGNGNTTIIYQYPDPTTGVITQSPYNPNIENNITVNCDCNGSDRSVDNIFGTNPQDPYTLTSSMLWADGFGVEISDNPLTAANESQQTLAEAASEYADSVNVASNSFNILPVKWLTLVGLLGGILIIAGLIRTFLGG